MEATEFARFKALAIFLHQIELCERQNRVDLDYFSYLHGIFLGSSDISRDTGIMKGEEA